MEDQQPGSGDLTADAGDVVVDDVIVEESENSEAAGVVEEDVVEEDIDEEDIVEEDVVEESALFGNTETGEPSPGRKWLSANKTKVLVGSAVGSFVLACAFAGGAAQPYLADQAMASTKLTIAKTAVDAITTLWTYTPADMDKLPERSAKFLSGDFKDQYRKFVDAIAATNKQAEVSNTTQVVAAAVESVQGNDATALVYTNTTSTSPKSKIPSMKYLSYRLDFKRTGTDWLVTKMSTVTSLDLTPKL